MSSESPKSLDAVKNRIAPYSLWLIIALVATNLLALYTFALHPVGGSDSRYYLNSPRSGLDLQLLSYSGRSHDALLISKLNETLDNLQVTQIELMRVKHELSQALSKLDSISKGQHHDSSADNCECFISNRDDFPKADEFRKYITPQELPLGFSPLLKSDVVTSPVGHACLMHKEDRRLRATPSSKMFHKNTTRVHGAASSPNILLDFTTGW